MDSLSKLDERFRKIRSYGDTLTLYFKSDSTESRKGFYLLYEFTGIEKNCKKVKTLK